MKYGQKTLNIHEDWSRAKIRFVDPSLGIHTLRERERERERSVHCDFTSNVAQRRRQFRGHWESNRFCELSEGERDRELGERERACDISIESLSER